MKVPKTGEFGQQLTHQIIKIQKSGEENSQQASVCVFWVEIKLRDGKKTGRTYCLGVG